MHANAKNCDEGFLRNTNTPRQQQRRLWQATWWPMVVSNFVTTSELSSYITSVTNPLRVGLENFRPFKSEKKTPNLQPLIQVDSCHFPPPTNSKAPVLRMDSQLQWNLLHRWFVASL